MCTSAPFGRISPLLKDEYVHLLKTDAKGWSALLANYPEVCWDLSGVDFSGMVLTDRDLRSTCGLTPKQFQGTVLTRCKFPPDFQFNLSSAASMAKNIQTMFLVMLLGCAYCVLTALTISDQSLILNNPQTKLPVLAVGVEPRMFFLLAPIVLVVCFLCLLCYLSIYWHILSRLPIVFPDDTALPDLVNPFPLSGSLFLWCPGLKDRVLRESRLLYKWLVLWHWSFVLVTIWVVFLCFLPRHELSIASALAALVIVLAAFEVYAYKNTVRIFDKEFVVSKKWLKCGFTICVAAVVVPLAMAFHSYSYSFFFFDLRISVKDLRFYPELDQLDKIVGYDFSKQDLSRAVFSGSLLANSDFSTSLLRSAKLDKVNLYRADFHEAYAPRSFFDGSILKNTNLSRFRAPNSTMNDVVLDQSKGDALDFSGALMKKAQVRGVCFNDVDFSRSNLSNSDFTGSELNKAVFDSASLYDSILQGVTFVNASFGKAVLERAKLDDSNFTGSFFGSAVLVNASLRNVKIDDAFFVGANLSGAQFKKSFSTNVIFDKAILNETRFEDMRLNDIQMNECMANSLVVRKSKLTNCSFAYSSLVWADFGFSQVSEVDFSAANLSRAEFKAAVLHDVKFINADLTNAKFHGARLMAVNFDGAILRGAKLGSADVVLEDVLRGTIYQSTELPTELWTQGMTPEEKTRFINDLDAKRLPN